MDPAIVITGAGSGLGQATARLFSAKGWRVALLGRRIEALQETASACDGETLVQPCDIGHAAAVETAFAETAEAFGRIDCLFNNAGAGSPARTIDETPLEDWFRVLSVNLTGAYLCARSAFAQMRAQSPQGGRIINNGSVSAQAPRPGSAPYTSTKHAITGLTKSLALDGRPYAIACGQIDIGNALTDMARPMLDGVPQADGSTRPEPTMDPAHVAQAVYDMATLPLESNILQMTIMATNMPLVGRG
ncbi:MAG: SDR family oxidoreductase [Pseudomonadota bacterium]